MPESSAKPHPLDYIYASADFLGAGPPAPLPVRSLVDIVLQLVTYCEVVG